MAQSPPETQFSWLVSGLAVVANRISYRRHDVVSVSFLMTDIMLDIPCKGSTLNPCKGARGVKSVKSMARYGVLAWHPLVCCIMLLWVWMNADMERPGGVVAWYKLFEKDLAAKLSFGLLHSCNKILSAETVVVDP